MGDNTLVTRDTTRVLFVCLGNICRSPTAEGVARELARREAPELAIEFDSAGTADYHVGEAPDFRTIEAARRRGYDLSDLRARQFSRDDFDRFDLVLAMDDANLADLRALATKGAAEPKLFMDFAPHASTREVPDPYYGKEAGFDRVIDLVEEGARGLIAAMRKTSPQR